MPYRVEDTLTLAKSEARPGEDRVFRSEHFVAVVDGATQKGPAVGDMSPGAIAADTITTALAEVPPGATARRAVDVLTEALVDYRGREERPTASIAIYSCARREIWVVGTVVVRTADQLHRYETEHERHAALVRSAYTTSLLREGVPVEELREHDPGRDVVLPLLRRDRHLRNVDLPGRWYFGAVDGTPVPDRHLEVVPAPAGLLILATDGYPTLGSTLAESEGSLADIVREDPLMIGQYPQTKGVAVGARSFDDRSFVAFRPTP